MTEKKEIIFSDRKSIEQVEESKEFAPKFDAQGLIPVVTTDYDSGEVLMHGYMNREALEKTLRLGQAVYFSRSSQKLWHKGATSGLYQNIKEMRIDDDQDCIWLRVELEGLKASCHVGYRSCFYRTVPNGTEIQSGRAFELSFVESDKVFDPKIIYGDTPNPTKL